MEDMMELKSKIKEIIEDIQPYEEVDETTELLTEAVMDSVSILLLAQELEAEFDVIIEMEEINEENFKNMESIAKLIESKISS